jgi:hypothetical protein
MSLWVCRTQEYLKCFDKMSDPKMFGGHRCSHRCTAALTNEEKLVILKQQQFILSPLEVTGPK